MSEKEQRHLDDVKRHYEGFLGEIYSWMLGDFDEGVAQAETQFRSLGLDRKQGAALDLGCGSGIQSLALAKLGYDVSAVDFDLKLLTELARRSKDNIRTIEADILDLPDTLTAFDAVVCMGDTLTHLPTEASVARLFQTVQERLNGAGQFVVSFRDMSRPLTGIDRAIPVRLDDDRLMMTFLEYGGSHVTVNDISFSRENDEWQMRKSAYSKLRLASTTVRDQLFAAGFGIYHESTQRGLTTIAATARTK